MCNRTHTRPQITCTHRVPTNLWASETRFPLVNSPFRLSSAFLINFWQCSTSWYFLIFTFAWWPGGLEHIQCLAQLVCVHPFTKVWQRSFRPESQPEHRIPLTWFVRQLEAAIGLFNVLFNTHSVYLFLHAMPARFARFDSAPFDSRESKFHALLSLSRTVLSIICWCHGVF